MVTGNSGDGNGDGSGGSGGSGGGSGGGLKSARIKVTVIDRVMYHDNIEVSGNISNRTNHTERFTIAIHHAHKWSV